MHFIAYVLEPVPGALDVVEIYAGSVGTGATLPESPETENLFWLQAEIPSGVNPGKFLIQLVGHDIYGHDSEMWPYLEVR